MKKQFTGTDEEMEALRKKARNRFFAAFILTGIFFLLFLIFSIRMEYQDHRYGIPTRIALAIVIPLSFSILAFLIFLPLIAGRSYDRFSKLYKDQYVLNTLRSAGIFQDLTYDRKGGFTYRDICNAAVVNAEMEHYFQSEDMVTGAYRESSFMTSDVQTKKFVKNGKTAHVETIFNGQVLRFEIFDDIKTSSGFVQVFQKDIFSDLRGWTAPHRVEMEDAAFNRKFTVYASDEHNAYYILTPQLTEKIIKFSEEAKARIAVCFIGSVMYVAVNRKVSMFDPCVDKPVAEQKQNILNDLQLIRAAGDLLLHRYLTD